MSFYIGQEVRWHVKAHNTAFQLRGPIPAEVVRVGPRMVRIKLDIEATYPYRWVSKNNLRTA